jgi:hypothetical protein
MTLTSRPCSIILFCLELWCYQRRSESSFEPKCFKEYEEIYRDNKIGYNNPENLATGFNHMSPRKRHNKHLSPYHVLEPRTH